MNEELLKVSLRQRAIYLSQAASHHHTVSYRTLALVAEWRKLGFVPSEPLLHAVDALDDEEQQAIVHAMNEVMGTDLNWASLVKEWLIPTGQTPWDHFITSMANLTPNHLSLKGITLPCGHFIPEGTFPLERYNGCPFCGTPFITAHDVNYGQGTSVKLLNLWGDTEMQAYYADLLQSPVPLDATQRASLATLLSTFDLPTDISDIAMKETRLMVIDALANNGHDDEAMKWLNSPADVLRYLWYRHTGQVLLIKPATLLHTERKNHRHECTTEADREAAVEAKRQELKLKYPRPWCRRVARWLNAIDMPINSQLEAMHPQRGMWVRFIRALRLAEYAHKPGYEHLAALIDTFYKQQYTVWQGHVDTCRRQHRLTETLALLQQRPGLFARCLFSTMLHFGPDEVVDAFRQILDQVPPRLLLSLSAQAETYFNPEMMRLARPLTGIMKTIGPHPLLQNYSAEQHEAMQQAVRSLFIEAMQHHFEAMPTTEGHTTIYIDPQLFNIPMAVGDRNNTVQDTSAALQGTRFPVKGDHVRLFLQWGKGLPAQHLDMDLSCHILTDTEVDVCAYFNLQTPGAQHSGDIQRIPDMVGTAEYVELSLSELQKRGARRVVFTSNAYTKGGLSPNLMVGWMSADKPMTVNNETGVAYDPSTVDHMVRITEANLSKGLIFGVLDVTKKEITWLEIPFDGQTVLSINPQTIEAYLHRLQQKPSIGQMLTLMAQAQHLTIVDLPDQADDAYTLLWAENTAQVARLLLTPLPASVLHA